MAVSPDCKSLSLEAARIARRIRHATEAHVTTPSELLGTSQAFVIRMKSSVDSLICLGENVPEAFDLRLDMMTVLRSLYEAHIQYLYIFAVRSEAETRAKLFTDYDAIEKWNLLKMMRELKSPFAQGVAARAASSGSAAFVEERVRSVRAHFEYTDHQGKKQLRKSWYPSGGLPALAQSPGVGLYEECQLPQKILSGAVHSNPSTLYFTQDFNPERCIMVSWTLMHRVLLKRALHFQVPLEPDLVAFVGVVMKQILWDAPAVQGTSTP